MCYVPKFLGFQTVVILDPYGVLNFHGGAGVGFLSDPFIAKLFQEAMFFIIIFTYLR